MCPYTLDHNKMLASTMQHSTHNHTPAQPHPHHTQPDALEDTNQKRHREHTHRCPLRTQQRAKPGPHHTREPVRTSSNIAFHPATPTPGHPPATHCSIRRGNSARRPNPTRRPTQPQPTTDRASTPSTRWLLRKEVIQPHLPVRLPCYDFVPIASPTFDDSPRRTG